MKAGWGGLSMSRSGLAIAFSPRQRRFDASGKIGDTRRMVALDEIADARRREVERAHRLRLEGLVEDIWTTIEGPSSAKVKVARIRELLAVQGYRDQE